MNLIQTSEDVRNTQEFLYHNQEFRKCHYHGQRINFIQK